MKNKKKKFWYLFLNITLIASLFCLMSFDIGAEYTNKDACGNDELPDADDDAYGFTNTMKSFGHTSKFIWGNANFWPEDLVDCSVSGGLDCYYGDNVTALYLHSHGGSTTEAFRITTGTTHKIDNINTCRSYTYANSKQWWKLGDKNLRYLFMVSCHSLQLSDLAHWDGVAKGIHMITGGSGLMYSNGTRGSTFAWLINFSLFRQTLKDAWFSVRNSDDVIVVMAYGSSRDDALNRRDHEKLTWSTAPVSPSSWRAWAWVE
jgi:hypothetical protein